MPVITFATLIVVANDSLPWMPIEQAVLKGVPTSDNWHRYEPDRHFDDCPIGEFSAVIKGTGSFHIWRIVPYMKYGVKRH